MEYIISSPDIIARMHIGIDVSQIAHEGTGVARFMGGLIDAILTHEKVHTWKFLYYSLRRSFPTLLRKRIRRMGHELCVYPIAPTFVSMIWNDIHKFPVEYVLRNMDWFISSDWVEPPSVNARKATIVHDLAFIRYPETVHPTIRINQQRRLKWIERESHHIFTDSEATRSDVLKYYQISPRQISVNYPGVVPMQQHSFIFRQSALARHRIKKPFILTVGKMEPRKNIKRLIDAFHQLKKYKDVQLVIVGADGWGEQPQVNDPRIKFLGYVSDDVLSALYQEALCFAYPSIWEGFGYPPLEAMSVGTPVVMSNTSSLGEIGGNVALFFDPFDVTSIADSLERMISDDILRQTLVMLGKERVHYFSWEKYYANIIRTLERA